MRTRGSAPRWASRTCAALERAGVVATPKHFVVNNGDGGRDSYPVSLDVATLEDLHFPPFRAAIEQGEARSVMASYNSVNGLPASASADLLTRTLRGDWKFGGVVIADQGGVGGARVLHHTAASYAEATARSLRAGLDVIFQSSAGDAGLFWPAFRDGMMPLAVIDTAVARVLRLKFALGLFEHPYVSARGDQARADESRATAAHDLALHAAEESVVLLRNVRATLPLRAATARLAVIGVGADTPLFGGYTVTPPHPQSLIRALNARLPVGDTVLYAPGPGLGDAAWVPVPEAALRRDSAGLRLAGLRGEYFANPDLAGPPASTRVDGTVDFRWTFNRPARGLGTDWYSVRWSGGVDVPAAGGRLAVEGDDGYRLWVDDTLVIDADRKVSYGLRATPAPLAPGRHTLRLEYRQTTGTGRVRLLWNQHGPSARPTAEERIAAAEAIARRADVAVVTVGVDEGEFRDRSSLHLPGRQEELIERVAATGTPVVVVVYSGGAVIATPWIEKVGAVLLAFYPGEAGAEALTRILFGDVSPAGRLPYTVPRSDGQLPLVYDHLPTGRGDDYVDLTGQPLFPFGYGLSYSTFEYSRPAPVSEDASAGDTVRVRFTVTNSGRVAADEVPQFYVRHLGAPTAQPVLALRGFTRLSLRPGESRQVEFALAVADLAVRDLDGIRRVLPEDVILYVGASSRDIRLRGPAGVAPQMTSDVASSMSSRVGRRTRRRGGARPASARAPRTSPPTAPRPRPPAAQLAWQRDELALFLHFGVNTFTDREWGDGTGRSGDLQPVVARRRAVGARGARRRRAPSSSPPSTTTASASGRRDHHALGGQ